jgi:hypothetical protein
MPSKGSGAEFSYVGVELKRTGALFRVSCVSPGKSLDMRAPI